eukprot:s211_g25.t1
MILQFSSFQELQNLQAPFVVTKPSSRCLSTTAGATVTGATSKREQRQETWPRFLVHPESRKRLVWDCLACMMLFAYTVVAPMEVFHFAVDAAVMSTMLSVRSLWLFFWILDIGMTVFSWLLFDLAFIGLDLWSIICLVRHRPILRIAAVGKFLFMARGLFSFRFHKLLQHDRLMGKSAPSGAKKACGVLVLILVILVTAVHLLACLWFFCGNVEDGWVETEQLLSESWHVQYARSLQWALSRLPAASMASNMALNTAPERVVALGATFRSRQYKKKVLKAASSYIHGHNLSKKHLNQVKHIVEQEKLRQEKTNQLKFLQDLPENFRQVLFCEARGQTLSILSFYKTIQEDASAEVNLCSTAVSELFLLPEERWTKCSAPTSNPKAPKRVAVYGPIFMVELCVFLVSGCTYSTLSLDGLPQGSPTGRSSQSLVPQRASFWTKPFSWLAKYATVVPIDAARAGSGVFRVRVSIEEPMSEQALWVKAWQHQGTLRSHTTGGGVVLQTKQFYQILAEHPNTMFKAVEHAREFVCRMNECLKSEASITDLPITGLY